MHHDPFTIARLRSSLATALRRRRDAQQLRHALRGRFRGERYAVEDDGHWVTIGAHGGDGGSRVFLDKEGNILKGPAGLTGQHVGRIRKTGQDRQTDLFTPAGEQRKQKTLIDEVEIPPAKPRSNYGPYVKQHDDGRISGPAFLTADQLKTDAKRFQYKVKDIGEDGVTAELKDVKTYNPDFGGQLLAWHDPQSGEAFVVNGHHRHELARRSGYADPLAVRFVDAHTAAEARAIGALANIAEGRGTAVDAAKFLRDTGFDEEKLARSGVSLKGRIADQGKTLSKLSDRLFDRLATGSLDEGRSLAIASHTADHAQQDAVLKAVEAEDKKRREPVPDSVVARIAKRAAVAGNRTAKGADLFGDWEEQQSLLVPRAELESHVLRSLRDEANTFKAVSTSRRAGKLEAEGRNTIDAAGNRQRSDQAAAAADYFDQQSHLRGEVSDLLNQAAQEYVDANAREKLRIKDRTLQQLRSRIVSALAGTTGPGAAGSENYSIGTAAQRLRGQTNTLAQRLSIAFAQRWGRVLRYEFDESKHNRDHGKFATKPGAEGEEDEDAGDEDAPQPDPEVKARKPKNFATKFIAAARQPQTMGQVRRTHRAVEYRVERSQEARTKRLADYLEAAGVNPDNYRGDYDDHPVMQALQEHHAAERQQVAQHFQSLVDAMHRQEWNARIKQFHADRDRWRAWVAARREAFNAVPMLDDDAPHELASGTHADFETTAPTPQWETSRRIKVALRHQRELAEASESRRSKVAVRHQRELAFMANFFAALAKAREVASQRVKQPIDPRDQGVIIPRYYSLSGSSGWQIPVLVARLKRALLARTKRQ